MCGYAAAGLAIAIIGLAATGYSMNEQREAVKAENKSRAISAENARESFRQGASTVNLRLQQEQQAATDAKLENAKRAAEARGTARVASGAAGVAGLSVDNLLADFYRQEATYRAVTDENLAYSAEQTGRELKGLQATSRDREASFRPEPLPDYLAQGLQIGGQAVGAYRDYRKSTNPNAS